MRLVRRCRVILFAFGAKSNQDIAALVGLGRKQVGLWRRRWKRSFDAIVSVECSESHAQLFRSIENVLSDASRSGCRGKFTGEQVAQILATACEDPALPKRPVSDWTARELADEVVKREYVDSISVSTIGRLLKSARLQPHRSKYWLNTKEESPSDTGH